MTGGNSGSDSGQSAPRGDDASLLEVFISYRRQDAAASAGRLADALVTRFGRNSVFMDVDTIEPGADYTEVIDRAVGHCDVLIALIGPNWLNTANARGRRLDDPQDLVRLEIESALSRNIRVVPTLVGGAEMPTADQLPGALAALAKRNAVELTDKRFRSDLQFLLEPLEKLAQQKSGRAGLAGEIAPAPAAEATKSIARQPPTPTPAAPNTATAVGAPRERGRQAQPPAIRRMRTPFLAGLVAVLLLIAGAGAFVANRINANNASSSTAWPGGYIGTWKGTGHEFSPPADFAVTLILRTGKIGQTVGSMDRPTLGCQANLTLAKTTSDAITLTEQGGGGQCASAGQGIGGDTIVASRNGSSLAWREYQGDPSKSSALATATLSQGTSGSINGSTDLLAVPQAFIATWKGTGHEFSPSADFAITIIVSGGQLGQTVATMNRPTLGCQAQLTLDKAASQTITLTEQGGGGQCAADGQGVGGSKIVATLTGGVLKWQEYQGDPSATSAVADARLAQGASGPIPGTSNLLAVPDNFVGTWKGTGHEFSPSADFAITLIVKGGQIGETVASMDRPTLGCQADLTMDSATDQSILLTEQGGGGQCAAAGQGVGGTKIVVKLDGSSLDWSEYPQDPSATSAVANGKLQTG